MIKFAVIDCETEPFKIGRFPQPFIWGFFDGKTYLKFDTTHALITHIKNFKGKIYAHNGGKFDYHFVIDYAELDQKVSIINGRLSRFKIGNATMLDSFNILPVPLKAFNKTKFDYWKLEPDVRHLYIDEIESYLKDDCYDLYNAVYAYLESFGYSLTLAGGAFKQWRKISGMKRPQTKPWFFEEFRKFYYGGRVECFKSGQINENAVMIDIKSAYPAAMKHYHPITDKYDETAHPTDMQLKSCFLIVECKSFGALPYRFTEGDAKGSIGFPHGKGIFYCTGWEFISAIKTNTIKNAKIIMAYCFRDLIAFDDYIDHFYDMKATAENNGDKAGRVLAKLHLNSLYGKFAQDSSRFKDYKLMDTHINADQHRQMWHDDYSEGVNLGNVQIWQRDTTDEPKFINIATSASITGYVRAFLWESINKVNNPIYCDTDSIVCSNTGVLPMGDKLGDWEKEMDITTLYIGGKKLYCFVGTDPKGKRKIKKASKGGRLTASQLKKVANGETVLFKNKVPNYSFNSPIQFINRNIRNTSANSKRGLNNEIL